MAYGIYKAISRYLERFDLLCRYGQTGVGRMSVSSCSSSLPNRESFWGVSLASLFEDSCFGMWVV